MACKYCEAMSQLIAADRPSRELGAMLASTIGLSDSKADILDSIESVTSLIRQFAPARHIGGNEAPAEIHTAEYVSGGCCAWVGYCECDELDDIVLSFAEHESMVIALGMVLLDLVKKQSGHVH